MYCFRHDSRWGTEWKTPRRIRFCVRVLKKRSTRFSHEELVGTKWKCTRFVPSAHSLTLPCLWVE